MRILSAVFAICGMLLPGAAYATHCPVNQAVVAHEVYAPVVQQFLTVPVYSAVAVSDYQPVSYRNVVQKQVVEYAQPVIVEQPVKIIQQKVVKERQRRGVLPLFNRRRDRVEVQKVVEVQKIQKVRVQKIRAVHGAKVQKVITY